MDDFRPRDTALEYWFVKVGSGPLAFLVDWIVRREAAQAQVRVSLWVRGKGRVVSRTRSDWRVTGAVVEIADCSLTPSRAAGEVDDVRWDLGFVPGASRLDPVPLPAKLLHPFDLEIVIRPRLPVTGTVEVAGENFHVTDESGTFSHYWGRRLPDAWAWVSATLDDGRVAVEAALLRTRLRGLGATRLTGGYVMADDGRSTVRILAPGYGRIVGVGDEELFQLRARTLGRSITLNARAQGGDYNDLGEGIRQTLIGDLKVDGWGSCSGRAGLELRGHMLSRHA